MCSALLYESGLKPSLATMIAKASERVIADPLGWEKTANVNDPRDRTVHMK